MSREPVKLRLLFNSKKYKGEIKRYMLLLIIPLIMCIALFIGVRNVIMGQIRQRAELQANHFYVQSASMLREMQIVSDTLLRDKEFIRSVSSDSSDEVDALELCNLIRESMHESAYIGHVYAICDGLNKIYSDKGYFNYQSLSAILAEIGADSEKPITELESATMHILNGSSFAPYCAVPITTADGKSVGTLIVTLKMTEFLRIFFSLDADVCCVFNDDFYISSVLKTFSLTDFDWHDEQAVSALVGDTLTCFYLDVDDYTYLIGISRSEYNKPLLIIVICFFAYAFIVVVIGYLYLYKISKKRQAQIESIIDALPTDHTGGLSSGDIYSDIRRSLLEYRSQSNDVKLMEKGKNMHNLLYGHYGSNISEEQLKAAGLYPPAGTYYVVSFFINDISNMVPASEKTSDAYEFARVILRTTLINHINLSDGKLSFNSCVDYDGLIVIFGAKTHEEDFRDNVIDISENAVRFMSDNYNITLQAMMSSPITDVNDLPEAFSETRKLISFAKSVGSSAELISQEDLLGSGRSPLNSDFIKQEQILISSILIGKYSVIPSMVSSILNEHVSPLRKNYPLAQNRLLSVQNALSEGVLISNLHGLDVEEAIRMLREADSVSKLNAAAEKVYGKMAELVSSGSEGNDTVSRACEYIHEHVSDQNLNVAAVCEAVGVSVQRLTRLFQAKFDMAIAEYMNSYRISLAKELMPDKSLTITQIALRVGYNNNDTLTRNFRKVEGITPSEYRKLLS